MHKVFVLLKQPDIYVNRNPSLPNLEKEAILDGRVYPGVHIDSVWASRGDPTSKSKSIFYGYYTETWIYEFPNGTVYLNFENDILVNISRYE